MKVPKWMLSAWLVVGAAWAEPVEFWRMPQLGGWPEYDRAHDTAIVIPYTDDNGDGVIDARDGGDVIVVGSAGSSAFSGRLRVLEGRTGQDLRTFAPLSSSSTPLPFTTPAAGDLDGDGYPEILVSDRALGLTSARVFAMNWDGTERWQASPEPDFVGNVPAAITLADLDGDGRPEVLVNKQIYDSNGLLRLRLPLTPCLVSFPLDLDLDGIPEIICGASAARLDGTVVFDLEPLFGPCSAAPAQLDDDPEPELLITHSLPVAPSAALDSDGTILWRESADWARATGGANLAVADVNADGVSDMFTSELNLARDQGYCVMRSGVDGQELWRHPSGDPLPVAGSMAWLGGALTVLHSDGDFTNGWEARSGAPVLTLPALSNTRFEYPVFADLDGDGQGELVVVSDRDSTIGVRAWKDPTWCDARAIWNQHAYVPAWIGDDLRPTPPPAIPYDWLRMGFRVQRNDCACVTAPTVEVRAVPGCAPPSACVSASVTGGVAPFSHAWTLPDGTTSSEASPCFDLVAPGTVSVVLRDSANCEVFAEADVTPPPPRAVSIRISPNCAAPSIQCAEAVVEGAVDPLSWAWILPDGSASADERPCFLVDAAGAVSVEVTDDLGCIVSANLDVEPYVPPELVELSAPGSVALLRVARSPVGLAVTWQGSQTSLPMALWSGDLGTWYSHAAVACVTSAVAEVAEPGRARYLLAGEVGCGGESGPLGSDSQGGALPRPASGCP